MENKKRERNESEKERKKRHTHAQTLTHAFHMDAECKYVEQQQRSGSGKLLNLILLSRCNIGEPKELLLWLNQL